MCLVKVRQEEDVVVPYRVVSRNRSPSPQRRSSRRISRTEVIRESRPQSSSYIAVPTPKPLAIPPPQPVPVFVQPSPPPPPPPISIAPSHHSSHHHGGGAHYVEVSPESSVSDVTSHGATSHGGRSRGGESEYVVREREYRQRRREYSPESSPRYEHFRYVEAADPPERYERFERRRSRSRQRSPGRDYGGGDEYRHTRERVVLVDDDGRRRREYRR